MFKKIILGGLLSLTLTSVAYAIPTTVTFNAYNFQASSGLPAPTDPVVGSIVYDVLGSWSVGSPVISVDLTIGSHVYAASEVTAGASGDFVIIGAVLTGTNGITYGTDDFWFVFNGLAGTPSYVDYSVNGASSLWGSSSFESFSLTAAAVPEPGTIFLLGAGLAGLAVCGSKRRKAS